MMLVINSSPQSQQVAPVLLGRGVDPPPPQLDTFLSHPSLALIIIMVMSKGSHLDFDDGVEPFHRWTNGGQPSINHRYQWLADHQKKTIVFNGCL